MVFPCVLWAPVTRVENTRAAPALTAVALADPRERLRTISNPADGTLADRR
jgi:hypothetical protein